MMQCHLDTTLHAGSVGKLCQLVRDTSKHNSSTFNCIYYSLLGVWKLFIKYYKGVIRTIGYHYHTVCEAMR